MAQIAFKRYAKALFELACENNQLDLIFEQVQLIYNAILENKEFEVLLQSPEINKSEKMTLMENIFKGNVSDTILGVFNVVFHKNRENELLSILEEFLAMVREYKGIVLAEVVSATALSPQQVERIKTKLSGKIHKEIILQTKVDPSVIGGLYIEVCGCVIDGTIKRQLLNIKQNLLRVDFV